MRTVAFTYAGQLASAAGQGGEELELSEGATLGEALGALADRHGPAWADLVFDAEGRVRRILLVACDGVQAAGRIEELPLDGVAEVMLMTPIAGG